jgi:hypothetical protein
MVGSVDIQNSIAEVDSEDQEKGVDLEAELGNDIDAKLDSEQNEDKPMPEQSPMFERDGDSPI